MALTGVVCRRRYAYRLVRTDRGDLCTEHDGCEDGEEERFEEEEDEKDGGGGWRETSAACNRETDALKSNRKIQQISGIFVTYPAGLEVACIKPSKDLNLIDTCHCEDNMK